MIRSAPSVCCSLPWPMPPQAARRLSGFVLVDASATIRPAFPPTIPAAPRPRPSEPSGFAALRAGEDQPRLEDEEACPDSFRYLPIDQQGADLLFQVISERYEHGAMIVTTNRAYKHWPEIFNHDTTLTALIIVPATPYAANGIR